MNESQLQTKVLAWLRKQPGNAIWHQKSASAFERSGWPDIIGCFYGLFVGIELKHPDYGDHPERGLSAEQEIVANQIIKAGGAYLCANSLEAVKKFYAHLQEVKDFARSFE